MKSRRPYEVPLLVVLLMIPVLWVAPRRDMPTEDGVSRDRSISYFQEHRAEFEMLLKADPAVPHGLGKIAYLERKADGTVLFQFVTGNFDSYRCIGYTPHSTNSVRSQFNGVSDFAVIDEHWFYIVYL